MDKFPQFMQYLNDKIKEVKLKLNEMKLLRHM